MERPQIKLSQDARISIELANGSIITLTIPKEGNLINFNFSDGNLSVSPRTMNEISINLQQD